MKAKAKALVTASEEAL